MDDDGGIQYWQQLGQHELQEYEAWLDEVDKRLNELDKRFNSELSNEEESK